MIAVVGGGISGLAVGHYLAAAGREVAVLESSARPGGVISTVRSGNHVLDLGPQRARLTPLLAHLVQTLGLTDQLRTAPPLPLFVYTEGRLRRVPMDLPGILTTDLISWPHRMRALLEPLTPGMRPDESAADYFTRKFGRGTYRRLLAPLFGGLYASDPADMRARHALASMLTALGAERSLLVALFRAARTGGQPPACSFHGGLQTLTDALAGRLEGRLRLNAPVRALYRDGNRLRVVLETGELTADRVVLACPPAAAATIIATLHTGTAERIARLRMNPLAAVHLEADAGLRATGYQVGMDEGLATHGVTSQHDLFGRTHLYTAFLRDTGRAPTGRVPDRDISALAVREFERVTGAAARALATHYTAIPAWDTSWRSLDDLQLPDGVEICANWRDRPGLTGRLGDARRLARKLAARPSARRHVPVGALAGTVESAPAPVAERAVSG